MRIQAIRKNLASRPPKAKAPYAKAENLQMLVERLVMPPSRCTFKYGKGVTPP